MARRPGEVRLYITDGDKIIVEPHYAESSSFREFVSGVEPAYLNQSRRGSSRQYHEPETRKQANQGRFRVHRRNKKYHFGFGFGHNTEWSLTDLFRQFGYGINADLSIEEKLLVILEAHPNIQEAPPDESGTRWFYSASCDSSKSDWGYHLTNDSVVVLKGPKVAREST